MSSLAILVMESDDMGHTKTCKYSVKEYTRPGMAPVQYGMEKLPKDMERFVMGGVVATMPGFINEHIGVAFGITIPARVTITAQLGPKAGQVVREWKCPAFMVLPNPADYPEIAKKIG